MANSYWDICMSRLTPFSTIMWYLKEMYVLHYMYYNNDTFLQANSKVPKMNLIVLFFFKIPKLNNFQEFVMLFKVAICCNSQLQLLQ